MFDVETRTSPIKKGEKTSNKGRKKLTNAEKLGNAIIREKMRSEKLELSQEDITQILRKRKGK